MMFKTIAEALARKPERLLWCFAAYYAAQIAVRLLMPHGLRIDEAQQVYLSQWLLAGYDAQPPLYNWAQYAVFAVTGNYLFGLAALKAVMLFSIMASYYVLGRMVLGSGAYAALACLGLFLTPQVFWQAQRDLTHTTATMLLVNLLMIAVVQTIRKPGLPTYLALGAAIGFGMLTKYNFAILLPGLALTVLALPDGRSRLFDWRILLTAAVALIIVAPHLQWLVYNVEVASEVTARRMAEDSEHVGRLVEILIGTSSLLANSALIIAPAAVLMLAAVGPRFLPALKSRDPWSDFFLRLTVGILLTLFAMILAVTFTTLRDRWLMPLLQLVPLLLCLKLRAASLDGRAALARIAPAALLVMALLLPGTYAATRFDATSRYRQPFDAFAETFRRQTGIETAGLIVTVNWYNAGNLKMQFPDSPVVTTDFDNLRLPYEWPGEHPIVLIWRGKPKIPDALAQWLADETGLDAATLGTETVHLPYTGFPNRMAEAFQYIVVRPNRALTQNQPRPAPAAEADVWSSLQQQAAAMFGRLASVPLAAGKPRHLAITEATDWPCTESLRARV